MEIIYSNEDFFIDNLLHRRIFLAGPTPRKHLGGTSWRPEAIEILKELGYDGIVFVPEPKGAEICFDYDNQIEWEFKALQNSSIICFWIPRKLGILNGLTTNIEFGRYVSLGFNCSYGRPEDSDNNRYLDLFWRKHAKQPIFNTLRATLAYTVERT